MYIALEGSSVPLLFGCGGWCVAAEGSEVLYKYRIYAPNLANDRSCFGVADLPKPAAAATAHRRGSRSPPE